MVSTPATPTAWDVAHVLAEPHRRAVFDAVRRARRPLTRDEVARTTGINRRLSAFHLDRLAEAGLLDVDFARSPSRRPGPGAGRPAKRYVAADIELDLTVPPRHYDLAAQLLAQAVVAAPHDAETAAMTAAFDEGKRIGALRRPPGRRTAARDRAAVAEALRDLGYEPAVTEPRAMRLCNCPFRSLAAVSPQLVCRMNHELVRGLLAGIGLDPSGAALAPAPPDCCVAITTAH